MTATNFETLQARHGCGGHACQCAADAPPLTPRINGMALLAPGEQLSAQALRERACTELLRQEAVRRGLIAGRRSPVAPEPTDAEREALEQMVDTALSVPEPDDAACQRYYHAHTSRFVTGQAVHVRHILFAVTPGVDVRALARRAESTLMALARRGAAPDEFAARARELSNCPSGQDGGDLGWLSPHDCASELAKVFFFHQEAPLSNGLHQRLVHSRYGLHIVEVLGRRPGDLQPYARVRERIARQLALVARATALRQYMAILAGAADIIGVSLDEASSPLVQ